MLLRNRLKDIAIRFGLLEIYAFGSRAHELSRLLCGETPEAANPLSDVDIGVREKPGTDLDPLRRVLLTQELEDVFKAPRVDLVFLQEADPFLALEILRGELLYAENLDSQASYELYILRRAGDLAPLKRERIRMILEEGAR